MKSDTWRSPELLFLKDTNGRVVSPHCTSKCLSPSPWAWFLKQTTQRTPGLRSCCLVCISKSFSAVSLTEEWMNRAWNLIHSTEKGFKASCITQRVIVCDFMVYLRWSKTLHIHQKKQSHHLLWVKDQWLCNCTVSQVRKPIWLKISRERSFWLYYITAVGAQKPNQNRIKEHILSWSKDPRPRGTSNYRVRHLKWNLHVIRLA